MRWKQNRQMENKLRKTGSSKWERYKGENVNGVRCHEVQLHIHFFNFYLNPAIRGGKKSKCRGNNVILAGV